MIKIIFCVKQVIEINSKKYSRLSFYKKNSQIFLSKSFVSIKKTSCKTATLFKRVIKILWVISGNPTNNAASFFSSKPSISILTISNALQGILLIWDITAFIFYFKKFQSFIVIVPFQWSCLFTVLQHILIETEET